MINFIKKLFGIKRKYTKKLKTNVVVPKKTKIKRAKKRDIRRFLRENKELWNDIDALTDKAIKTGVYSSKTKFNMIKISLYRRIHGRG